MFAGYRVAGIPRSRRRTGASNQEVWALLRQRVLLLTMKRSGVASLSVPRAADMVAVGVVAVFDSGSGLSTMSVGIARKLQESYPRMQLVGGMQTPDKLRVSAFSLSHPRDDSVVLMFPDTSDLHYGSFLTQLPAGEVNRCVLVEDMTHEPLGFLSGTFRGAQQRWATVDTGGVRHRQHLQTPRVPSLERRAHLHRSSQPGVHF